jgi:TolB-like protein/Flp pilus assembly protein TadD/predicted Ser/Thr protein kinase
MLSHYRLIEKIGAGGMGQVYRAEDTRLGREIAIKVLPTEVAENPDRRRRFELEARAVATLKHPNIVTIYSVEEASGVHFITMELIDGQPLSQLIPSDGFELSRFFELATPLADALSSAHAKGIAHRDLKPANVMLDSDGRLKVLDFGLAKLLAPTTSPETATQALASATRTEEGRVLGTAAYMSPEQAEGKPVDPRSDIFSLGVVLYEMATGSRPFQGDTPISTISSILKDTPSRVSDLKRTLPRHLGRIIERCLEKKPGKRFQTARDVVNELEGLKREVDTGQLEATAEHVSETGPRGTLTTRPGPPVVKAPRRASLLAVAAVVVVGLSFTAWWVLRDTGPAPTAADGGPAAEASAHPSKTMIAVLPFDNLGPAEDAYFAAGVTDEIIGRLAVVSGLGVISRTSTTQYDRTGKTLRQIGEDLGVSYVLEGTVRWARAADGAGRVRITPRLIRVADDSQLWAETYDQQIDDIFEVQSTIAGQVIDQLGISLLGGELTAVDDHPTDNLEAYQAYLKASQIPPNLTLQETEQWIAEHLERATLLDPGFLEAWAELSRFHSHWYHENWDRTESRLERAKEAMARAVAIDATHPYALLARGYYYYFGFRDYDRALEDFLAAIEAVPSNSEVQAAIGYIHRRQGKWDEATAELRAAAKLAPRDTNLLENLAETRRARREFHEAAKLRRRIAELEPENTRNRLELVYYTIHTTGEFSRGMDEWRTVPQSDQIWYSAGWAFLSMLGRDFEQAHEWAAKIRGESPFIQAARAMLLAHVKASRDGIESARPALQSVVAQLESMLDAAPANTDLRHWLAVTHARLGNAEAAIRESRLAIELTAKDRFIGPQSEENLAEVYATLGRAGDAVDLIERLLRMDYNDALTVTRLRLDFVWDPIRDNPRFQALLVP